MQTQLEIPPQTIWGKKMSDVSVSLKLSPTEFDLLREALREYEMQTGITKRDSTDPKERTQLMQTLVALQDLQRKLK